MKKIIRLLMIGLFLYAVSKISPGCSSSKKTQSSKIESASHVVKKDSNNTLIKKEAAKVNQSLTGVKTNSVKNRVKQKQTETEESTTEYQPLKIKTDAKDYFPSDGSIIRLNDSLLLVAKKTIKKQREKKQTQQNEQKIKDSTFYLDTSTSSKEIIAITDVKQVDTLGKSTNEQSYSKWILRFQWWWLLGLLVIFLFKRVRKAVGLSF